MDQDLLTAFELALIGHSCHVAKREHDWCFVLNDGAGIAVSAPWRIVANGRIALADQDHGQQFGLPHPVDGEEEVRKLLGAKRITKAVVDRQTADLTLHFEDGIRLEIFNISSGYEGWQAGCRVGDKSQTVIALGGGEVAILFDDR